MSTVPLSPTVLMRPSIAPTTVSSRSASIWFLGLAAAIVVITFILPLSQTWTRSAYATYWNDDQLEVSAREGTIARQIGLASLGLFGLAAIAWPGGKRLQVGGAFGVLCVAYLAWCAASCLWSDEVGVALRRYIALMCEVVAAVGIAKRTSARQFVWLAFACAAAWLVLGIAAELSLGTFRPGQFGYRFAGLFHPNESGVLSGLLCMTSLYLVRGESRRTRWSLYAVAAIAFAFLLLSNSRTSIVSTLLTLIIFRLFALPAPRLARYIGISGMVCGLALFTMGLGAFDISSDIVKTGRSDVDVSSLTGRLPLWQELISGYVVESPIIGHGYGAFWTANRVTELTKTMTWAVASTHSTYIDLLLNVGLIGAALCLSVMVLAVIRSFQIERRKPGLGYGFIGMIAVCGLADGVFETTIGLTWFLSFFICGVCYLLLDTEPALQQASLDREPLGSPNYPLLRCRQPSA